MIEIEIAPAKSKPAREQVPMFSLMVGEFFTFESYIPEGKTMHVYQRIPNGFMRVDGSGMHWVNGPSYSPNTKVVPLKDIKISVLDWFEA